MNLSNCLQIRFVVDMYLHGMCTLNSHTGLDEIYECIGLNNVGLLDCSLLVVDV